MGDAPALRTETSRHDPALRGAYALLGLVISAFVPFLTLVLRERGLSPDDIGIVLAVLSLSGVLAAPFWSHTADTRLGSVHTLQLACAAASVAGLALIATGSQLLVIAAVCAVLGAAQAPYTALTDSLALSLLGPERVLEYGSFRLWQSVGWGVGCVAIGAVLTATDVELALPLYAGGVAIYAVYVARFGRRRPGGARRNGSRLGSVGEAIRTVDHLPLYLLGVFTFATSTHAAGDFVPLRIVTGGGDALLVGVAAGVSAFVEIPFMRSSGTLTARFGLRAVFTAGAAVYAAASLAWSILPGPLAVTVVRIAIGVGFALTYVSMVQMTAQLVPERLRNTGQALLQICTWGLAPMVGDAVGGVVYQHLGPPQLFVGSAVGIVVGIAVVWLAAGSAADAPSDVVS
jgi:MFS transporter, PPP family, 3-phenylpropionic acid transporter